MERGRGEDFCDDMRGVDPDRAITELRRLLPANVLAGLTCLDPWRASLAILQTSSIAAAAFAIAWTHFEPWIVIAAVALIGTQQHALFVLAHDAAHYRLFETRSINEFFGRLFGTLGAIPVGSYRVIHRLHHNNLYGEADPDIALHAGYPRGSGYLVRKLAQDLVGLNAWKNFAYFFGHPAINDATRQPRRPLDDTSAVLRAAARRDRSAVIAAHLAVPALLLLAGGPVTLGKYLVLWIVPLVTVVQPILRLRAICEHGAVVDKSSPLTAARTNVVGPLARLVLFPHHVNYHVEHHLFPAVPHYRLPQLHHELARRGITAGAEMRPLADTLRRVFAPRGSLTAPD
ncbi:MAG TPA: fatty acid desaturase family protein [Burkholderiaceae bacterium]|nr:fatty acid desaturase family protein [Burkholderiaceae bacterium]